MKRFYIFLVFGILLLATGAKAEIVYLNCKFQSGSGDDDFRNTYIIKKGELGTEDVNISLDTKQKKIIKAPSYSSKDDNKGNQNFMEIKSNATSKWLENEIIWDYSSYNAQTKVDIYIKYILNRRSSVLDYTFIHINQEKVNRWHRRKSFLCTKESKKF
jgi:hypothetical protein